jgi:hypothetical protein
MPGSTGAGQKLGHAEGGLRQARVSSNTTQEVDMSLSANIDHLAIAAGIEAVVVDIGSREYRGDDQWHRVLDGALDLFRRTDEKSIRLVVGKHTIVVQKEGEETVAVVLPTGHAIAKSLRRMIRRMARKDRGPLPKEYMQEGQAATGQAQPGQPQPGQPQSGHQVGTPSTSPSAHTTPSPTPVSSPTPTPPASGQPSGGNEDAKPTQSPDRSSTSSSGSERGASDRGGFNF